MVNNADDDPVLKEKHNRLLVLINKMHQLTSPRWCNVNSDDDDANSLFLQDGAMSTVMMMMSIHSVD
jgi:hypothetical protein